MSIKTRSISAMIIASCVVFPLTQEACGGGGTTNNTTPPDPPKTATVKTGADAGGLVNPSPSVTVNVGGSTSLTFIINAGKVFDKVVLSGGVTGALITPPVVNGATGVMTYTYNITATSDGSVTLETKDPDPPVVIKKSWADVTSSAISDTELGNTSVTFNVSPGDDLAGKNFHVEIWPLGLKATPKNDGSGIYSATYTPLFSEMSTLPNYNNTYGVLPYVAEIISNDNGVGVLFQTSVDVKVYDHRKTSTVKTIVANKAYSTDDNSALFLVLPDSTGDLAADAKEVYKYVKDDVDFILFEYGKSFPSRNGEGYQRVRNEVNGICVPISDNSSSYGSNGKLGGVIYTDTVHQSDFHAIAHHWGVYYSKLNKGDSQHAHFNIPSTFDGPLSFNWLLEKQANNTWKVVYRSNPQNYQKFSTWILYLGGFAPASYVQPLWCAFNVDPTTLNFGSIVQDGQMTQYSVTDFISENGARSTPTTNTIRVLHVRIMRTPPNASEAAAMKLMVNWQTGDESVLPNEGYNPGSFAYTTSGLGKEDATLHLK